MPISLRMISTPVGPARVTVERPARGVPALGSLVLSHGAGGGIEAPDLVALRYVVQVGWTYVRVEQPWRVAGRRIATAPATLDVAWIEVLAQLRRGRWALPRPLIVGGRSAGARVACRTAVEVAADGVLALSFPLVPPKSERSRAGEAALVVDAGLPLGVIQGDRDPFGSPDDVRRAVGAPASVYAARGNHSFTRHPQDVLQAAREWLTQFAQ